MADAEFIDQYIEDMMYMQWLRPENVPWDVHAAKLIAPHVRVPDSKTEIGCGNGFTSFSLLGGRFKKEFDWYYSVATKGFWENKDIYDVEASLDFRKFVHTSPAFAYDLAVDHKENLVNQALAVGSAREIRVHDANVPLDLSTADMVFSNMLYWLDDPVEVFGWISRNMKPGARLVTVFPNSNYKGYSRSFKQENLLWTMLNRGRADENFWSLDPDAFEALLARDTDLKVVEHALYLSRQTLSVVDIGLRPFSPHLIKMANVLGAEKRFEIKTEWCEDLMSMIRELALQELEDGPKDGGFNFYVLQKA
ncbi:MAG: hypothetical protein HQL35_01735 [Alphaproteobacteria bacterium]|nr:hypothetical protein [Alphaproteobacteria bacterium]